MSELSHFFNRKNPDQDPNLRQVVEEAKALGELVDFSMKKASLVAEGCEKVAIEFSPSHPEGQTHVYKPCPRSFDHASIPEVKQNIADRFNLVDASGRLFSVFKQYYICLNEACGGTVRVSIKDGVCSLWNYDEWEEFAYVDVFDGGLRFCMDERYGDELVRLSGCEVPRLLSRFRRLSAVNIGDLNETLLTVLVQAFNEAGMALS